MSTSLERYRKAKAYQEHLAAGGKPCKHEDPVDWLEWIGVACFVLAFLLSFIFPVGAFVLALVAVTIVS